MSRLRKATNRLLRDKNYEIDDKVFYDEIGECLYILEVALKIHENPMLNDAKQKKKRAGRNHS